MAPPGHPPAIALADQRFDQWLKHLKAAHHDRTPTWSNVREQRNTTPRRRAAAREALENQIAGYRLVELRKARGTTPTTVATTMGISQRRSLRSRTPQYRPLQLTTLAYIERPRRPDPASWQSSTKSPPRSPDTARASA